MAHFEDNNPFSGSERRLSSSSGVGSDFASLDIRDRQNLRAATTSTLEEDHLDSPSTDTPASYSQHPPASPRVYSSRVEQILHMFPDEKVIISEAGKSKEGNSRGFIVYTIKLRDIAVRRRYSEFESLRTTLTKLFPTLIIPPIPEKHSISDYAAAPTKAKEDATIIEHRRRMLAVFLNRCKAMSQVRDSSVFQRFLDPNANWSEVLHSPPVSLLPKQILKAPPLNPSAESDAHSYLPVPPSSARLHAEEDSTFQNADTNAREYEAVILGGLEKVNRRIIKKYTEISVDLSELGAKFNAFSLEEEASLASSIEKVGQALDNTYISTEAMVGALSSSFSEPLGESSQFASVVRSVLKFRRQKAIQLELTTDSLATKKASLESLERSEQEAQRISAYLHRSTPGLPSPGVKAVPVSSLNSAPTLENSSTLSGLSPSLANSESTVADSNGDLDDPQTSSGLENSGAIFPPTHADTASFSPSHKKKRSVFSSISGISKLNSAIHSIVDSDPETTRRHNIGKTREQISQLEEALAASKEDVELVSESVKRDLLRFQHMKEEDLKAMMVSV